MGLALTILAVALAYEFSAFQLERGSATEPGPGLFPSAVGIFWIGAACFFLLESYLNRSVGYEADGPRAGAVRTAALPVVGALAAFAVFLPRAGYLASASVLLSLLLFFHKRNWVEAGAVAIAAALGTHYVFSVLLDVPLPRGQWLSP